ncbi:DUF3253 domain-containing protein [Durusdinium trenchii]|uniref:DUF3253 domain-containing protein n=1 Tax=Durusdinium trenchii TaxID=1381693 RepID=A0ABP0IU30_9DINO
MQRQAVKLCERCGRTITWRKKWERNWDSIKYCSKTCRGAKLRPMDETFEAEIVSLLGKRSAKATICPSEVARRVLGDEGAWRGEMEAVRQAVRRLAARNVVCVRQRGHVVDPFSFRGPIRVGRGDRFDSDVPNSLERKNLNVMDRFSSVAAMNRCVAMRDMLVVRVTGPGPARRHWQPDSEPENRRRVTLQSESNLKVNRWILVRVDAARREQDTAREAAATAQTQRAARSSAVRGVAPRGWVAVAALLLDARPD